jgi:hypothetical protein
LAERVTLKISAAAAAYTGKDVPQVEKLKAASGGVPLPAHDLGALLYFLAHDQDSEVRTTAVRTLRTIPESLIGTIAGSPDTNPRVIDLLARLHFTRPALVAKMVSHPHVGAETLAFLAEKGVHRVADAPQEASSAGPRQEEEERAVGDEGETPEEETEEVDEESEEFKSKYQLSQQMGVAEKIKAALTGDKEWRSILIKDSNKLVSGAAVKNPRITEAEVLAIAKSAVQNDEIMRVICANKEWIKNYQIRKALVVNTKTPLPFALRQMATLSEKDITALAKSKNVSTVIATQARRILLNKQQKGR